MANSTPVVIASDQSSVGTVLKTAQAPTTGTITSNASVVTVTDLNGVGAVTVGIAGTHAGINLTFEITVDGTNWVGITAQQVNNTQPSAVLVTGTIGTNAVVAWNVTPLLGVSGFRVRSTAYTSGTGNITIRPSAQFSQGLVNIATIPTTTVTGTVTSNLGTGGTAATSLGKAEDAAHTTGDTGVAIWGVRNDGAATSPVSNNNDYTQMSVDDKGRSIAVFKSSTGSTTTVAAATASTSLLASSTSRVGVTIINESSSVLYVKLGATASNTSYTIAMAGSASAPYAYYEVPYGYTGAIDGIWVSATGNARITDIS